MPCFESFLQFDDQTFALELQLGEIEAQRKLQSGKWPEASPPDYVLAFDDFEAEMRKALLMIEDLKFAYSIAGAVASDVVAIEQLRVEETQSIRDRDLALSLNQDVSLSLQDVTNMPEMSRHRMESVDWDHVLELQKLRLLAIGILALTRTHRPVTLSARMSSLDFCTNSKRNVVSVEKRCIVTPLCAWDAATHGANLASSPFSCALRWTKAFSRQLVTANQLIFQSLK